MWTLSWTPGSTSAMWASSASTGAGWGWTPGPSPTTERTDRAVARCTSRPAWTLATWRFPDETAQYRPGLADLRPHLRLRRRLVAHRSLRHRPERGCPEPGAVHRRWPDRGRPAWRGRQPAPGTTCRPQRRPR